MTDAKHIIIGLLLMLAGVITLRYNFQIVGFTGNQDWIENKMGGGSTYGVYKLFSVALVFTGILYGTGLHMPFFNWLLSPFLNLLGGGHTGNTVEVTN